MTALILREERGQGRARFVTVRGDAQLDDRLRHFGAELLGHKEASDVAVEWDWEELPDGARRAWVFAPGRSVGRAIIVEEEGV